MKKDPRQVRLPELPLIKKYSLAVRQEFASAQEVLALLQRSVAKIETALRKSAEEAEDFQEDGRGSLSSAEADAGVSDLEAETVSDLRSDLPFESDVEEEPEALEETKPPVRSKPKSRVSRATPKPKVVRVSHVGAPIGKKQAKPKTVSRSKPKKSSPTAKTASRSKPKASRSKPKAASRKVKTPARAKPKKTARKSTKRGRR